MRAVHLVRLLRPHQWYKNLIVFVPLVFSENVANRSLWPVALLGFAGFVLLASAAYAWNDAVDAPRDRLHPKKKHRPVASGHVSVGLSVVLGVALAAAGLVVLGRINAPTLTVGVAFLALQVVYNAVLKAQVLWDVLAIGVGFVLRALGGTTAINVGPPTVWLILCTFLLALFLGFGKRRHELVVLNHEPGPGTGKLHRAVLGDYTVELVEHVTNISATLLLASYFLYTALGPDPWLMLTIPFAVYGVFRYLYLIKRRDLGEEPELIFRDRSTLINAAGWFVAVLLVLQGLPQRFLGWLQGF